MENKPPPPRSSWVTAVSHPLRKFFGGVLATVFAGSIVYFVFNNPTKIKGRTTLEAWNSVLQYEDIYDENLILMTCKNSMQTVEDMIRYKSDFIHLLQMTSENFKNIREESNVDNRLFAIINLKVDTYNQTKDLTEFYIDSVISMVKDTTSIIYQVTDLDQVSQIVADVMQKYREERQYLFDRDTATINHILSELTDSYSGTFYKYRFTMQQPNYQKKMMEYLPGKWIFYKGCSFSSLAIRDDNSAVLIARDDYKRKCRWQLKQNQLILTKKDSTFSYNIGRITNRALRLLSDDGTELFGYKEDEPFVK